MRALKGTLTFVLGMIIGIILFVIAIGGTIVALGTAISVGDLQNKLGVDIIEEDSEIYNQSILDTVKTVIDDVQKLNTMSLQELINKYGIPIPNEVAGVDISEVFKYPLNEISSHVDDIVNSISLKEVLDAAGVEEIDLPIIQDNQTKGITDAVNAIVKSINSEITIRQIKNNFGIDIGVEDNVILNKLQDLPLSKLGDTINYLRVNDLINASTDTFVKQTSEKYIKVDIYELVSKEDLKNTSYSPIDGIDTFIYGTKDTNNDGKTDSLVEKELRFVKSNDTYKVDNSCYNVGFDAETNTTEYYRHYTYKLANGTTGVDYYIKAYANTIDTSSNELIFKDFVLATSNTLLTFTNSNPTIAYPVAPQKGFSIEQPITKNSKLIEDDINTEYVQYSIGDSSSIIKTIAFKTVYELQNDSSFIDEIKLGEVLTIDDTSSQIVKALKDKKIGELSTAVDDLLLKDVLTIDDSSSEILKSLQDSKIGELSTAVNSLKLKEVITINDDSSQILKSLQDTTIDNLSTAVNDLILDDAITIVMDDYTLDDNGLYVKIEENNSFYYTMYNPAVHTDLGIQRYTKSVVTDSSSKILQRLRSTKINAFSDGFDKLVLSDVLDVTPNIYEAITYTYSSELAIDKQYYYYDDDTGLYLLANSDYISSHNLVYQIAIEGTGSNVIRRLAYVKIDNLSAAMETIMDDLLLSDVIDITMDNYTLDNTNGLYAKVYENGASYYTVYNPAIHTGDRYTKSTVDGSSSKILQRLASIKIGDFSNSFDNLVISDLIDITPDVYSKKSYSSSSDLDKETVYYSYDSTNNLFIIADDTYLDSHTFAYYVSQEGSGTKLIRKLAYVKVNELASACDIIIDDLLLSDVVDITMDNYTLDNTNGLYAKVYENGASYYTVYNPAIHTGDRYTKSTVDGSSSKILQRLANTKIKDMSNDFSSLVLADVINITPSLYEKVEYENSSELSANKDYYYYDDTDGLYLIADDTYIGEHSLVYQITKISSDNKIIQKLAYVKLNNLNSAIEKIIDDMYISDIVDIVENYAVEKISGTATSANDTFFIASTGTDESGKYVAYIYDSNGKYVKRNYSIQEVNVSDLTISSTKSVNFIQVSSQAEAITYASTGRLYYSADNGTTIKYIPELATYIAAKTTYNQSVDGKKLYYSVDAVGGTKTYNIYSDSNLYVLILGQYVKYDSSIYMHCVQEKFYKKVSGDCYVNIGDPTPVDDSSYACNKSTDVLLSKVYCENIFTVDNAGLYVFYDNSYVLYDSSNNDHNSLQRYSIEIGYIATTSEAFYLNNADNYESFLSPIKVNIINEKSSTVLTMLKKNKTSIKNMSEIIDNAQIKDLLEVTPDSIFSIEYEVDSTTTSLQECKINELSSSITDMLNSLTIGDFLNLSNIQTSQPQVKEMIKNIKLPQFFSSLKYDAQLGIYVDIEAIYA